MEMTEKKEFVEIEYTGYANGEIFDSNVEKDVKKLHPNAKARKTIVIIGQGMVVPGLDKALEGKEIGKDYEIKITNQIEGFGERKRDLVKTIPLKIFKEKNIMPYPGMTLNMDNLIARVITISGGRVITDFNNPLSGKIIDYKFKISRKVKDEKERVECVLELLFKFVPDFDIGEKVVVKGPKILAPYVDYIKARFNDLVGKEIEFKEVEHKEHKHEEGHKHEGDEKHEHKKETAQ